MNWKAECERWHQTALKRLKQTGRCPFRLRVYTPIGVVDWTDPTGLSDEGRARLRGLNQRFREGSGPTAVLACSDSWQAGDAFWKHHGLESLPYQERQDRYSEILGREYKDSLENVPDELRSEAVFTILKGPGFMPEIVMTFYRRERWLPGDRFGERIIVGRRMPEDYGFVSNLVPDWWEAVIQ